MRVRISDFRGRCGGGCVDALPSMTKNHQNVTRSHEDERATMTTDHSLGAVIERLILPVRILTWQFLNDSFISPVHDVSKLEAAYRSTMRTGTVPVCTGIFTRSNEATDPARFSLVRRQTYILASLFRHYNSGTDQCSSRYIPPTWLAIDSVGEDACFKKASKGREGYCLIFVYYRTRTTGIVEDESFMICLKHRQQ